MLENQLYLKHSRFSSIKQKSSLVIKMCSTRQKTQIIGCVFDDLPSEIALENVSTSFTAEYLLNEDGDLEIRKIYRTGGKQTIWINAKHPSNAGFDDLLSKKNQELKAMIRENGLENSVNLTINTEMRTALWESLGGSITYQKKLINWDQCDVPKVSIGLCMQNVTNAAEREKSIKSWLNGSLSKKITKEDLEDIDAWDEIELWFKKIGILIMARMYKKSTAKIHL